MNRRVWIKQVIIAGGSTLFLPACINDEGASSVALENISITDKQEQLLADLCEAIIPQTDTPGAKALNLHQFILKMFDDCYDKPQQQSLVFGLKQLNNYAKDNAEQTFSQLTQDKKLVLLKKITTDEAADKDLKLFLAETRKWIIKGYSTSEYVLTKINTYELVPGRFHGCVEINKAN